MDAQLSGGRRSVGPRPVDSVQGAEHVAMERLMAERGNPTDRRRGGAQESARRFRDWKGTPQIDAEEEFKRQLAASGIGSISLVDCLSQVGDVSAVVSAVTWTSLSGLCTQMSLPALREGRGIRRV